MRAKKAGERRSTPGVSKKLGRSGEGVSEKGEGVGRKGFLRLPRPLQLLVIFHAPSQFSSLCVSFWKRLVRRLLARPSVRPSVIQSVYQSEAMSVSRSVGHFKVSDLLFTSTPFLQKTNSKRKKELI